MAARIPFPATPADSEFYTEANGMRWQWSELKHRWSFKPLSALSSAFQTSSTTPTSTELPWYNPDDGTLSIWDTDNEVWVVSSGAGTDGEDGADLTTVAGIVTVATVAHELVTANLDQYNRFTYAGADPRTITVPVIDGDFAAVTGSIISLRNTSATTSITINAEVTVSLEYATGANIIGPRATAQLLCVDATTNQWDIL